LVGVPFILGQLRMYGEKRGINDDLAYREGLCRERLLKKGAFKDINRGKDTKAYGTGSFGAGES